MITIDGYNLFQQHFGTDESSVYPGHPITVAWIITQVFSTYEKAFETEDGQQYPNALGSSQIPGAGDNVWAGMRVLRMLRHDQPISEVFEYADEYWRTCDDQVTRYPDRWKKGQEQADKVKPLLMDAESWWKETT